MREPGYIIRAGKALGYADLQTEEVTQMLEKMARALAIKDTLVHLNEHVALGTISSLLHELTNSCGIGNLSGGIGHDYISPTAVENTLRDIQETTDRKKLKRMVAILPEAFHIRSIVKQQVLPKRWYDGILRLFGRD